MTLARFVASRTAGHELDREGRRERLERRFPPGEPHPHDVGDQEGDLTWAAVAVGGADAAAFAPLAGAVVRRVESLAGTDPEAVQPRLAVLGVVNGLQVMGVEVPADTVSVAAGWPATMQTAHDVPEWMHWNRGLAALALGDLATARTIAALPAAGPVEVDLGVSPEWNVQGWFALLDVAVERSLPWDDVRPRWEELLLRFETFLETRTLSELALPWLARVAGHLVAGVPLPETATWLHNELHRAATAEPPKPGPP